MPDFKGKKRKEKRSKITTGKYYCKDNFRRMWTSWYGMSGRNVKLEGEKMHFTNTKGILSGKYLNFYEELS